MGDIVGLRGNPSPPLSEPAKEVVEVLERYLDQAKNGHIRGIAFCFIQKNGSFVTGWNGDADIINYVASSAMLAYRIAKQANDEQD